MHPEPINLPTSTQAPEHPRTHEPGSCERRVILVGLSTRAAAASAARAGYAVTSVDAFADRDQHPGVRAMRTPGRFSARSAERVARTIDATAVVYLSPFENHPAIVAALSRGRMLWGNHPDVLRRVRDPLQLAEALRRLGFPAAEVRGPTSQARHRAPEARSLKPDAGTKPGWLVKPRRSGGGQSIRSWRPGALAPAHAYVQRFVDGAPWSVVFVAAAEGTVTLGMSRQLIGDPAFGASGYRYCGNILDTGSGALRDRTSALTRALAGEFGLIGVNGVDFIRDGDDPVAIEVNPRWSASMELIAPAGKELFEVHAAACASGALPVPPAAVAGTQGKAVVFARHAVTVGDTDAWLDDGAIRDVPQSGEHIAAGQPVCTIFASASDVDACYAGLTSKAGSIYAQLAAWHRSAA